MTDDILYRIKRLFNTSNFRIPNKELYNYVLYELEKLLNLNSMSLKNFNLPLPTGWLVNDLNNKLLREELNYDTENLKIYTEFLIKNLNNEQLYIYNEILKTINHERDNLFFIFDHGRIGKTYLWNTIISKIRSENKIVLAIASSGITSLLLSKGRIPHSRFRVPLLVDKSSTCHIKKGTQLANLIEKTSLILWDEAPMNNKYCFEALDKILQDLKNNFEQPFRGMTVVLGGDFRQILLVIPSGTKEEIIDATVTNFYLWQHFRILTLTKKHEITIFKYYRK